jgi:hypothetical protein
MSPYRLFSKIFQRRTWNARASHVGSNVWSRVHTMVMLERRADPNDGADVEVHQWSSGRSSGVSDGSGGGGDGGGGDGGAAATRTSGEDKTETTATAAAAGGREGGGRRRRRRQPEHRRASRTLSYLRIVGGTQNPKSWPWTSGTCSCRSGPHQHRPLE